MLIYLCKDHYNPVMWGTGHIAYSFKIDYSPGTWSPPCRIALLQQCQVASGHRAGAAAGGRLSSHLSASVYFILQLGMESLQSCLQTLLHAL